MSDIEKHARKLRVQVKADEVEASKLEKDRLTFLEDAARFYSNTLICGEKYDLAVFGLCNLWFNEPVKGPVSAYLHKKLAQIPSRKWLPLAHQIASRLGVGENASDEFRVTLEALMFQMAQDHPHHMMFKILALANGRNLPPNHRGGKHHVVDDGKITAANALVKRLKKTANGEVVSLYEALANAYVELSYHDLPKGRGPAPAGPQKIPASFKLLAIRDSSLPVSTVEPPLGVDVGKQAGGAVPTIKSFSLTYDLVGGINRPKRIQCFGSDGRRYDQLLKGVDDLKQDSVMQQFFSFTNLLLQREPGSQSRQLNVRCYAVIPLTPAAGVLEWVDGSMALGSFLVAGGDGSGGAHKRIHPTDLSHAEAHQILRRAATDEKTKLEAYSDVCRRFRPVLRHFFLERFLDPSTWFERRLRYARSMATSSMVGFFVGLGDRHLQNVLLDENSAEIIHIDLGIAFDQGRSLPVPETVPFRLTRDMVDGMGVTGVEGVFRRSCEETMKVLRGNASSLLTILSVFLHDPLFAWSLSPVQALAKQQGGKHGSDAIMVEDELALALATASSSSPGNRDAQHALLQIQNKLQGVVGGEVLAVEGHVAVLINEARDPSRLAKIFVGWSSWC